MVALDIRVSVPIAAAAAAMKQLDKPDPALDQSACRKTLFAKTPAFGSIDSIEGSGCAGFLVQLQGFGHRTLHLKGKLVRFDSGPKILVIWIINSREVIQFTEKAQIRGLFVQRYR